jgi:hypothetical protein
MNIMPFHRRQLRAFAIAALSTAFFVALVVARAQQPQPPPPPPDTPPPAESSTPAAGKNKHHLDEFLIRGTVFNDKALSLPGAQLHIKRAGDKKHHWDTYTNSRGEFAIRVPPGSDYEVLVQSRGFADATQQVDAKTGLSEEDMVFRMDLASGKKK